MARKIKGFKKEKKVDSKEIDNQIKIGLDMIRTVCDKEIYEKFYLLHLDSSPVIENAFVFINHGYRIKQLNNSLRGGDYNVLRTNVNTFVNNYLNTYQPTEILGLYAMFFIFNKWLHKYIKINEYKKLFKKENSLKKESFKEVYTKENYSFFNNLFKLNITKEDDIDPAYPKDWMLEFKHISELLKYNMGILDKYREKVYEPKKLKKYLNLYINSAELKNNKIDPYCHRFFEYKLILNLQKYFALALNLLKSKNLVLEMIRVKKTRPEEVKIDLKYIKDSMVELDNFLNKMLYLLQTGESITNPVLVKKKLKEYYKQVS